MENNENTEFECENLKSDFGLKQVFLNWHMQTLLVHVGIKAI